MLRLSRNLRFEVHKGLRLPRNLRSEVFQSAAPASSSQIAAPATKSALQGPPTKSVLRGSQSAALATKSRYLRLEVHKVLRLPQNLHCEVHKVLCLPRNLRFKVHKALRLPRNLQTSHMSKSHDSLQLSRNQNASKITTCPKCCASHDLHFEVKPVRPLAPVTKSRLWATKARGFPYACQEK